MSHLVLSRKYRPQRFEDLVGQEHVAQTLVHAITSGRIGHAYLFIGPRGTGKTTTARIFAKALNCASGPTPTPCGTCDSCRGITAGNDLDVVEMDAASNNGVDDVRALRDSVGYRPARSRFRVWIVDEVHMLSLAAFNAFLKTLEEPPPQAKFLFCTTEAHKLPETFTSRVQRLEFRRIEEPRMAERLRGLAEREGLAVEEGVCDRIAAGALGGLRDAESLLEQLLSCAAEGRVTLADLDAVSGRAPQARVRALFDAVAAGDAGAALDAAGGCLEGGAKPDVVLDQWVDELRGLLGIAARTKTGAAAATSGSDAARAAGLGLPRIARSIDLLLEKRRHLKDGADGRLVAEVAAVELARLPSARDLDALVEALRAQASAVRGAGSSVLPASATPSPSPAASRTASPAATPSPSAPDVAAAAGGCAVGASRPPAAGAPGLDRVVALWGDFVQAAGKSRRLASGLIKSRPVAVTGDAIVLAVPETESIARGILRDREAVEAFREAARVVFGVPLRPALDEGAGAAAVPDVAGSRAGSGAGASARPREVGPASAGALPPPAAAGPTASGGTLAAPSGGATVHAPARGDRGDDMRSHPSVKAVIDAFGARLLAVQRVDPPQAAPAAPASPAGASPVA